MVTAPFAQSATIYWDGGTANWSGGSTGLTGWSTSSSSGTPNPTATPGASDDLIFNITTNNTANNIISHANGNRAARSITINTSGTTNFRAGGSSTAASTLTMGAGGITLNSGAGAVDMGQTPGSYGTITVALGANQIWTNNSSNQFTVTSAVTGSSRQLTTSGSGTIRLNGANTYSGATIVNGGNLIIGNYAGLNGTSGITVSGGTSSLQIAQVGSGSTTNTINKNLSLHGSFRTIGGSSTNLLALTWGGNITLAGDSTIWNNGNTTIDIDGQVDLGANALAFQTDRAGSRIDGNLIGSSGSLLKTGNQDLALSGTNTYTGTTTISAGTLRLDGTHTGGGAYTVGASGALQGAGSTTSALNISGTLSPGASVESFASGTLNLLDGSTFEYEVNSSVASPVGADLQVVTGDLNLTGTVDLTLGDLATSPVPFALGTVFSLLNYSGAWNNGFFTFDGDEIANGGTLAAGLNTWRLDYDATGGGLNFTDDQITGKFVNITAVVPEPGAVLLGSLGLLVLLCRRR